MAEKLSDKLKGLFKRADTYLGKAVDRSSKSTAIGPSQTQYKMFKAGQKTKSLLSGKLPKAATNLSKVGTLGKVARFARAATPLALGFEAANVAYKVATMSPEKKAKVKKLKTKLSKVSTKDYHADLMKMRLGGDTMLKNPKKADLDKDGKLSSYEKKRGKAIEANMKAKKGKMMYASMGMEAKSTKGYGAARTSGMGLQDEQLAPGKSLDYYKDLM